MYATLDHVDQVASNIQTFWFKTQKPVRYVAGQFIEFYLPHDNPDKRGQKHWFTLSSSPSEQLLGITTKFADQNGSTFKQALRALGPGTQVMFSDPMGDFVLPKDKTIPLVFVAGGIGVTPLRSMTKWHADTGEQRNVTLLYAATRADELAFTELFKKQYQSSFVPVIAEPDATWQGQTGRLDAEKILSFAGNTDRALFYLSGPEPMIEAIAKDLHGHGIPKRNIVTDFFPGYPA